MTPKNKQIQSLNRSLSEAVKHFAPPEGITVTEWAEKYRRLSSESSAEAGLWRTDRTPYLRDIMDAFTDPLVRRIAVVAASQVGKSECILNMIGYVIDQDPGSIVFVQPTLDDAKKFSRLRVAPMIRDCRRIRDKVADIKSRDSGNTILQKSFPGGMLTIVGSNSSSGLSSTPARYVFGDERDRWASSAGTEGDPWGLAEARQTSFYNAKSVEVSTPTIKGASNIETSFYEGTQEYWCSQCPECGAWHNITFDGIRFEHDERKIKGKKVYKVKDIAWACPTCGSRVAEDVMRRQPAKWIAENPEAYEKGVRSFWLNAFVSPWASMTWEHIVLKFLQAKDDPEKLQVVFNTLFGELWENRGNLEDEDYIMSRREGYGAELPEGALVLTCGVDTQDNRLEYEVVGHGMYGETWGIKKGIIMGKPDTEIVWQQLDDVLEKTYFYADGRRGLTISLTCIDSGGHYTQEVYNECRKRQGKRVFAIRGQGGEGIPYTAPPKQAKIVIDGKYIGLCWYYNIGVDAGKASIMSSLQVQEPGPKYCHFPLDEAKGYDATYFNGLLSEKMVLKRSGGQDRWQWEKLPGHTRNEPLDCRNYAMAAFRILNPNMDAVERRAKAMPAAIPQQQSTKQKRRRLAADFDAW